MGNWRFEMSKFALYVAFPIGAFILFNNDMFHDYSTRQATLSMSKDLKLDNLKAFEDRDLKKGIDSLASTIEEIDGNYTSKKLENFGELEKSK